MSYCFFSVFCVLLLIILKSKQLKIIYCITFFSTFFILHLYLHNCITCIYTDVYLYINISKNKLTESIFTKPTLRALITYCKFLI